MAAAKSYTLKPEDVEPVQTKYRRIRTQLPVPESLPLLEASRQYEPVAMEGHPPIVWDRAEGFAVSDPYGNRWIDFSSGVLVTNAGHGREAICDAIAKQANDRLIHNYCFPNEHRIALAKKLVELAPDGLDKAFLISTGSEATECAVKLSRAHGQRVGGKNKIAIISFENAFHGRTLGAQQIGGIPALKEWIGHLDPYMVQVPFPDGYRCEDTSFDFFLKCLKERGLAAKDIAGVITETYQGGTASLAPPEYIQHMRTWCDEHKIILTLDEVQAAFGRCGRQWGFEHYGIVPDLMCLGKGISSALPVSAVVGKAALLDQFPPGSMTSTHTGNPVCCASALANIDLILKEGLIENAARVGEVMHAALRSEFARFGDRVGCIDGKGLVAAVQLVHPGGKEPDGELAWEAVKGSVYRGVMLFSPVGPGGCAIKICPPLCITADAVREGVAVIAEATEAALKNK